MGKKRSCRLLIIGCVLLGGQPFFSVTMASEKFPFLAEVAVENVNIRAGQHTNFESLCRLDRGSEVVVVGKSYNWYKINLPPEAKIYISQEYAQMLDSDKAVVTRDRVNVRAGVGTKFSVLGQLNQGIFVKVLEKLEGWYRIEPVEGAYGWVGTQLLTFKSDRIPVAVAQARRTVASSSAISAPQEGSSSTHLTQIKPTEPGPLLRGPVPSYTGRLEKIIKESLPAEGIHYQLMKPDGMTYYLKGEEWIFEEFVGYQVKVEGKFVNGTQRYTYPVLEVQSVRLVL